MRISDWSSDVCSSDLISSDGLPNLLHRDRSDAHRLATTKLDIVQDTSGAGNPLRQDSARAMLSPLVPVEPVDMDADGRDAPGRSEMLRSEEHTSELQSLMRISYAVFCLKQKPHIQNKP